MRQIFSEFSGKPAEAGADEYTGSGDVKYHLGTSYNRPTSSGKMVALSLMANPRWVYSGTILCLFLDPTPPLRDMFPHLMRFPTPYSPHFSHLEAVDTVVLGKVRAKQYYEDDHSRSRSLPILLHGDGAFSGQGIVYETLDMSGLVDYTVGGCIHIVVNNQVGVRDGGAVQDLMYMVVCV